MVFSEQYFLVNEILGKGHTIETGGNMDQFIDEILLMD